MASHSRHILEESDVRAMIRLLGEVAARQGSHDEKKAELMNGLCRLVGADFWVWALATSFVPGEQPVYTAMSTGGFDEGQFPKLLVAYEHPDLAILTKPLAEEVAEKNEQITRLRTEYDPEDFFAACGANPLWRKADVGPPLLCYRPIQKGCVSGIGIYRRFDRPLFDEREALVADIILSEVPWLHEKGWPWSSAVKVPSLPHRCRLVLSLLLEGLPRKEIAERMDITVNTVGDYTKRIYAYFQVRSQSELLARFRGKDRNLN